MVLAVLLSWPTLFSVPSGVAQSLILCGGVIVLWHYFILKRAHSNLEKPTNLVRHGGLFRRLRHPMYFGDTLMFSGYWLIAPNWYSLAILMLAYVAITLQAKVEDKDMARRFPTDFNHWVRSSRLLLPGVY